MGFKTSATLERRKGKIQSHESHGFFRKVGFLSVSIGLEYGVEKNGKSIQEKRRKFFTKWDGFPQVRLTKMYSFGGGDRTELLRVLKAVQGHRVFSQMGCSSKPIPDDSFLVEGK
jgi:hypothetical protein